MLCILYFGVFQYLCRGITYMLRAPFFMRLRNISLTHSIDMKNRTRESLRHIAARIPQQSEAEIYATISSVSKELDIFISPKFLMFPEEGFQAFPVDLDNIHGALVNSRHLYILCQNGVFHHFDRKTHMHEVIFPDDSDICFCNFHMN